MNDNTPGRVAGAPALALALALGAGLPGPAVAEPAPDDSGLDAEISAGAEYDSNVAVLELDRSSGEDDTAAVLDLALDYRARPSERLRLKAGYDFSQSLYREFDEFDLRVHRGSADARYDLGALEAGAMLQYAAADLDGERFLALRQVSPYVSRLFGRHLLLRAAWIGTDKDFSDDPGRNSASDAWAADAYVLLDGVRTYFVLGYRRDDEDARDPQYDYQGGRARLRLAHRFGAGERSWRLGLGFEHEARDYRAPTPILGTDRDDRRDRYEATLEIPLARRMFLEARYEYADNRSNLDSADFTESVVALRLGARL